MQVIVAVHSGTTTLKDATSEAIRDWVTNIEAHHILGSVASSGSEGKAKSAGDESNEVST